MSAEALSQWLNRPPGSWTADDLDRLPPEAPRCEVLDGALIVMSPQRTFHARVMRRLANAIENAMPIGWQVDIEMTIRIDKNDRPDPDLVVAYPCVAEQRDRTSFEPHEVALVIEIVSPESVFRDRVVKPKKFADAGIPHYWLIDDTDEVANARVFALDKARRRYVETAFSQNAIQVEEPFPITVDVSRLYP
jgi:Uma2 family endonuclease